MGRLEIPLINTYLRIDLSIKQVPKGKSLVKELTDFFDKHKIAGIKIKSFEIDDHCNVHPDLQGRKLSAEDNYEEEIRSIGRKYCIDNLQFYIGCYGK
ncbi:MAG TPA: hypothetical protein PK357_00200 [Candidatus Pacearchaeota archaeon]|nr:hypothetical protein [Candidatus Pacearchaeota archaeon]